MGDVDLDLEGYLDLDLDLDLEVKIFNPIESLFYKWHCIAI